MSDGSPSLEEDVPKPLLERVEENVFTPKITTPIYAGGVKLHHKRSDAGETESFLSDAQRNDLAFQQLFQDGDGDFHEVIYFSILIPVSCCKHYKLEAIKHFFPTNVRVLLLEILLMAILIYFLQAISYFNNLAFMTINN